jgi:hypothetical protein
MAELYQQCWQVGSGAPSEYEKKLGDALEAAFTAGHHELPALVEALNTAGVHAPDGAAWTPQRFEAVIKRLGA